MPDLVSNNQTGISSQPIIPSSAETPNDAPNLSVPQAAEPQAEPIPTAHSLSQLSPTPNGGSPPIHNPYSLSKNPIATQSEAHTIETLENVLIENQKNHDQKLQIMQINATATRNAEFLESALNVYKSGTKVMSSITRAMG